MLGLGNERGSVQRHDFKLLEKEKKTSWFFLLNVRNHDILAVCFLKLITFVESGFEVECTLNLEKNGRVLRFLQGNS